GRGRRGPGPRCRGRRGLDAGLGQVLRDGLQGVAQTFVVIVPLEVGDERVADSQAPAPVQLLREPSRELEVGDLVLAPGQEDIDPPVRILLEASPGQLVDAPAVERVDRLDDDWYARTALDHLHGLDRPPGDALA